MDTIALTPSTATIDAGRLLTLERRAKFAALTLVIARTDDTSRLVTIDETTNPGSYGILDHGNIERAIAEVAPEVDAHALGIFVEYDVRTAMREWCDSGYPGICLPVKAYESENVSITVL